MSADELELIKASLRRIETAIVGDDLGNKGLAKRLTDVEAKAEAADRKLLLWGGIATGASVVINHVKSKFLG